MKFSRCSKIVSKLAHRENVRRYLKTEKAERGAQWQSVCLTCARTGVQPSAPGDNSNNQNFKNYGNWGVPEKGQTVVHRHCSRLSTRTR